MCNISLPFNSFTGYYLNCYVMWFSLKRSLIIKTRRICENDVWNLCFCFCYRGIFLFVLFILICFIPCSIPPWCFSLYILDELKKFFLIGRSESFRSPLAFIVVLMLYVFTHTITCSRKLVFQTSGHFGSALEVLQVFFFNPVTILSSFFVCLIR